jgi:hypothetical protein
MFVKFNLDALGQTKWHEYAVRFIFGGLITAVAGIIAKKYGATVGGLFMAFPAIFPASATMIEKHEREKKQKKGLEGNKRGTEAASVDAAGSAIGSISLFVFASLVWKTLPGTRGWVVLGGATLAWATSSFLLWLARKRI